MLLGIIVDEIGWTGIVGSESQNLTVWAETSLPYFVNVDYSGAETNYSVTFNFTRVDTGALVNGTFNITIGNGSVLDSQQCSGVSQCTASWLVPTNLSYGNYTINATATNLSAYYRNVSAGYGDYLEETDTTGNLYVGSEVIGDYNPATTYDLYVNATINNTMHAWMLDVIVFDYAPARGGDIAGVPEVQPCGRS